MAITSTYTAEGNVRASGSLAAGATENIDLDYSTKAEGQFTIEATPGTVAATNGLRVRIYPRFGTTPTNSPRPEYDLTIPSVASTLDGKTWFLGTGKWRVVLTNLDATNAITTVRGSDVTITV